jgi:AraC family transcriptional regulator
MKSMNYRIVEREEFQVVGIKQEFVCSPQDIGIPGVPEFWEIAKLQGTIDQLIPLINGQIKGLLGITENFNEEKRTVDYWIAAEFRGDVPSDFSSFMYPSSKWVVFEVKGIIPSAMINAWQYIYSEWFPSNEYIPVGLAPIEAYIDSNLHSENSMNEIWIAVK